MASIDIIADGLTIIRNGQLAKKDTVAFSTNKTLDSIVGILKEKGYVLDYKKDMADSKNKLIVKLKYDKKGAAVISKMVRVSKCSRRVYANSQDIPRIANGYATVIVSTNKGVMTGKNARDINQGGEILCYIIEFIFK